MQLFQKNSDERIVNQQNQIYRETYNLVLLLCLVSLAVKYFVYGWTMQSVSAEMVILIVPGLYYSFRVARLGIYSDAVEMADRTSKYSTGSKNVIVGVLLGVCISLFFGVRSAILYAHDPMHRFTYFIVVFVAAFMMYAPFLAIFLAASHKAAMKLGKNRNAEEDDEDKHE